MALKIGKDILSNFKKTWSVFSDVVSDQRMMVKVFNKNLARYIEFPQ